MASHALSRWVSKSLTEESLHEAKMQFINYSPQIVYSLVGMLTIVGALLRLWELGGFSLAADEYHLWLISLGDIPDFAPPYILSNEMIRPFVSLWGYTPLAMRLGPCLIGILTIPVVFWIGDALFDRWVGLVACMLISLSPYHLYFSQMARFYTTILLLMLCCVYAGWRAVTGQGRQRYFWWLVTIGVYLLAVLVNFNALIVPVPLAIVSIPYLRAKTWVGVWSRLLRRSRILLLVCMLIIAIAVVLLLPLVYDTARIWLGGRIKFELGRTISIFAKTIWFLGIPIVVLCLSGLVLLWPKQRGLFCLLVGMTLLPVSLVSILGGFMVTGASGYSFWTLPFFLYAASFVIRQGMGKRDLAGLLVGAILLILVAEYVSAVGLYFFSENHHRQYYAEAIGYIERHAAPDDLILAPFPRMVEYYANRTALLLDKDTLEVALQTSQQKDVWIIVEKGKSIPAADLVAYIRSRLHLTESFELWVGPLNYSLEVYRRGP